MSKSSSILRVHWDGPAHAQVVAETSDEVTLQRVVVMDQKRGQVLPFGDTVTISKNELASLARQ